MARRARYIDWIVCGRKKMYRSKREAMIVAARYDQRVYRCPCCKLWHAASKKKRGK